MSECKNVSWERIRDQTKKTNKKKQGFDGKTIVPLSVLPSPPLHIPPTCSVGATNATLTPVLAAAVFGFVFHRDVFAAW